MTRQDEEVIFKAPIIEGKYNFISRKTFIYFLFIFLAAILLTVPFLVLSDIYKDDNISSSIALILVVISRFIISISVLALLVVINILIMIPIPKDIILHSNKIIFITNYPLPKTIKFSKIREVRALEPEEVCKIKYKIPPFKKLPEKNAILIRRRWSLPYVINIERRDEFLEAFNRVFSGYKEKQDMKSSVSLDG